MRHREEGENGQPSGSTILIVVGVRIAVAVVFEPSRPANIRHATACGLHVVLVVIVVVVVLVAVVVVVVVVVPAETIVVFDRERPSGIVDGGRVHHDHVRGQVAGVADVR